MKHLPRALNRCLLLLIGLIITASGIGVLLVQYWPAAREGFRQLSQELALNYQQLHDRTLVAIPGLETQSFSWLSVAWITLAIIVTIALIAWVFAQGGGKVKQVKLLSAKHKSAKDSDNRAPGNASGETIAEIGFIDDLIQAVLASDKEIAEVKTSAWEVKKEPAVAISVVAYKGANLNRLKEKVQQAVAHLDSVLAKPVPIRVHFTTNWRTTFQSADRVD